MARLATVRIPFLLHESFENRTLARLPERLHQTARKRKHQCNQTFGSNGVIRTMVARSMQIITAKGAYFGEPFPHAEAEWRRTIQRSKSR
jgi:hypothetical protein